MCVSIFSTTFVRKTFHSRKNWEKYDKKSYIGLLFLSDFKATRNLSTVFRKRLKYRILWKFWSKAWVLKKREEQRLEAAQMKFLRHHLGITKLDKEKPNVLGKK